MDKMRETPSGSSGAAAPVWEQFEQYAREHIQHFIQQLLEEEVDAVLGRRKSARRTAGSSVGYRNGHGKPRQLALLNGTVTVRRPRVRDLDQRFVSRVLPFFQRRTLAVGTLLPELYLHGLSLGDFEFALRGLLGNGAPLSPSSILRLKADWQAQYEAWRRRPLAELELVYLWADGICVKARCGDAKAAMLVLVGGLADGRKVVLAVESGHRESVESWGAVLRDLKQRGLAAPKLTIADGHLGIWCALAQVYPTSGAQRCWNHKLRNVVDAAPVTRQAEVTAAVQRIAAATTNALAERAKRAFRLTYTTSCPKAVERLERDWERMVTYCAFPEEHWRHLRTTNVIESPFDAVRLRPSAAKRYKKLENATAILWWLLLVVEQRFRKLNAPGRCREVYTGKTFVDGVLITTSAAPATPSRKVRAA